MEFLKKLSFLNFLLILSVDGLFAPGMFLAQSCGFKKNMASYEKINLPEDEWKKRLSPEEYYILREKGTEPPFTGKYYKHKEKGKYLCAGCGAVLFTSEAKYDSGSGWPSFFAVAEEGVIEEHPDYSYGMIRTEITCRRCGGHLGHVFPDGPPPTGLRYCVNSLSLNFQKEE